MSVVRPQVTVSDDPDRPAFLARLDDGTEAGGAYYRRRGDVVIFTHTEVDPAYEGQGIGTRLVAGALALVREAGGTVVPLCPFVRAWMDRHPEHDDLLHARTDLGSRTAGPGPDQANPAQAGQE
ncbi:N-acetyltransferase [Xylanimonas oleitrophica]|uniref:N-acetyltransferase n=1 Tax=Xylanimonas oleitrophica TaxID=2607479 RepID=A0A2W5XQB8_9MICO|nr:GNAT family N-acetyltransferase [Xylanimonas oleitrophica]PZR51708.1 N-acetyltransferase [Xylanimonas oleitrophica]